MNEESPPPPTQLDSHPHLTEITVKIPALDHFNQLLKWRPTVTINRGESLPTAQTAAGNEQNIEVAA